MIPQAHPGISPRQMEVAFKAFVAMARDLGLSLDQQSILMDVSRETLRRWANGTPNLDRDKASRLGHLLAIYQQAGAAFPMGGARGWLERPNSHPEFDGTAPLDRMLRGEMEDILAVHRVARAAEALWV